MSPSSAPVSFPFFFSPILGLPYDPEIDRLGTPIRSDEDAARL